jgi:hypothetical protein
MVVGGDADRVDRPRDECGAVAMRQHHALRHSRRPGRVEDVGEVVEPRRVVAGPRRRVLRVDVVGGEKRRVRGQVELVEFALPRVEHDERRDGRREVGPPRVLVACGQQHRRAAVGRDAGHTRDGGARVEWHVRGARLQHAVHTRDRLHRLLEPEADAIAGADTRGAEQPRDTRAGVVELAVGEGAVAVHECDAVGCGPGRVDDALVQQLDGHGSLSCWATRSRWICDVPE